MDAYALFDALTDVRDGFLEETERRLHGKKRRRVGVYLLAAVLIALVCSCLLDWVPVFEKVSAGIAIVICTVLAAGICAALFPISEEDAEEAV